MVGVWLGDRGVKGVRTPVAVTVGSAGGVASTQAEATRAKETAQARTETLNPLKSQDIGGIIPREWGDSIEMVLKSSLLVSLSGLC
jgi:hypothetical protein